MVVVFNLLIILLVMSSVERSFLLENAAGQIDKGKAQERLKDRFASSSVLSVHTDQDDTRQVDAYNNPSHSDRQKDNSSIMKYPTTERKATTSQSRIAKTARSWARYRNNPSLQASHKSGSQNPKKSDSLTRVHSEHEMSNTNTVLMDTRFGENRSTDLNPSHIKLVQSGQIREPFSSHHQQEQKVHFSDANVRGCSTYDCDRQLCPWDLEPNVDRDRSPITVWVARCRTTTCDFGTFGWFGLYLTRQTGCDTITHGIPVVKDNVTLSPEFPVACICRYNRHFTSKSSNAQSHTLSGLLKTGPMTHTVKLNELPELMDVIEPEIPNRDLPVNHRNRKLRKHHGNESSDKKRKQKRQKSSHSRDVKIEESNEHV